MFSVLLKFKDDQYAANIEAETPASIDVSTDGNFVTIKTISADGSVSYVATIPKDSGGFSIFTGPQK